jgi:hypothetical protein
MEHEIRNRLGDIMETDDQDAIDENLLYLKFKARVQHDAKMEHRRHLCRVRGHNEELFRMDDYDKDARYHIG